MPLLLGYKSPIIDEDGNIEDGALMYVFEAGTTTPVTTYADAELSTPQTHPIEADANGYFVMPYVPVGSYKVRVTDNAAVLLWEQDNIVISAPVITDYMETLLADENQEDARDTLGCGSIATQDSDDVQIGGGTISGITSLGVVSGSTVSGNWNVTGNWTVPGDWTVSGDWTISGDLTISGTIKTTAYSAGTADARGWALYQFSEHGAFDLEATEACANSAGLIRAYKDATQVFRLSANGDAANASGTFGTLSDERTKTNIEDAGDVWDDFIALEVKTYIDQAGEGRTGLIAQDVQEIWPDLIFSYDNDLLGLNYAGFTPRIIKFCQELADKVIDLEQRVAALEG